MIDIETVSIMVTSAGILVALVYYAFVLRHQTKLRQTDLVMKLNSDWVSWEIEKGVNTLMGMVQKYKDYDEWKRDYPIWERTDRPEILAVSRVAKFFDIVGILLHRKLIDGGMVDEMFGYDVKMVWEKYSPMWVEGLREDMGAPAFRKNFEYLYNELKQRERKF